MKKHLKMKTLFLSIFAVMTTVSVTAQEETPSVNAPLYVASDAERTLSFNEQNFVIGVGGTNYTLTCDADWVTATKITNGVKVAVKSNAGNARAAKLTFAKDGSTKTVTLTQAENPLINYTDGQITVLSASASSTETSKESAPISNAIDNNTATYYHSTWSSATSYPVTLTFNFSEAKHVDRIIYVPRGNSTGIFKEVTVQYTKNGTTYTTAGSITFQNTNDSQAYTFPDGGVDGVRAVRLKVASSYSAYISAAEIKFYDSSNAVGSPDDFAIFADNICSKLKPGTTQSQISAIKTTLVRQLAQDLFDGVYDTEFRVGKFAPYRPIANLQSELKTSAYYDRHENPTGIFFDDNDKVAIMADGIGTRSVNLEIYNFALDDMGTYSTHKLVDGLNIISVPTHGLGYVLYYPDDYQSADSISLHFINGKQNGYFDLKRHDNTKWKYLLANVKSECMDILTPHIHMVAPVYALKSQCPARGFELAQKLDSVIALEWEIEGFFRHGRAPKNHQFVRPSQSGLFANAEGSHCAWGSFGGWVTPVALESWGLAHELGHNNQVPAFTWTGMTEVSNNLCSAWVQYRLPWTRLRLEDETIKCIVGNYRGGRMQNFLNMDVVNNAGTDYYWQTETDFGGTTVDHFVALVPLWQMVLYTMVAEKSPYAFMDWYEMIRTNATLNSASAAQKRVNFLKNICKTAKLDFFPFFEKAGMLKPMSNVHIDDYTSGNITISKATINSARAEIKRQGYPEVPAELVYMNGYNCHIFRDGGKLEARFPVNTGCTKSGDNMVKVDNYVWQNAVGYETYDADGNLLNATIYGLGDSVASDRYTYVIWKTSNDTAQPAYIMAVGCDGTRVKCYEP